MPATQHVFLIPGFFGFVNFGRLVYFTHVREFLDDALSREGLTVEIHRVRVKPTSSLRVRAAELAAMLRDAAPADAPLHLIGHSTGGLDARLVTTPGVSLLGGLDVEPIARRICSVISIATPHRGTPLAAFFSSLLGQQVLRLLSLFTVTVLRRGRLPVGLLARLTAALARLAIRRPNAPLALLEHLESELRGELGGGEPELIAAFLRDIHGDQALMPQLTPAAMDLFDASTADRPGVRYASVTARAPAPRLGTRLALGPRPWPQATYALYTWLHHQVGEGDGIVPIASQRRGDVLYAASADHLDVIGHFDGPDHQPPHTDWIHTGARFDRAQFEAMWTSVARFIAEAARPTLMQAEADPCPAGP
jgi:triacylglycerol lipase